MPKHQRQQAGLTVKKSEDFSEWYTQLVLKAELADYSSAKGFMVLRPYGYAIWEKIREYFDKKIKATGHQNAYFPFLIPESILRKEAEHFKFSPEVFWVTESGDQKLGERLAVRPTSETIIHDAYARWIRSWRDLPVLINVWNSVLRAEIKSTKPFLRTTEFMWQEGHTAHATKEEADKEVLEMLAIYKELVETQLAIPAIEGTKSDKEKFLGADYTTTLESLMPDGKALQMGTSHQLGQNFSRPFEIRFLGKDEKMSYVWQTSWGISWRTIGAVVMVHGDDKGLVLPPKAAPIQVVIVPIHYTDEEKEKVSNAMAEVRRILSEANLSLHVDDRDEYTPGWKFNEWELKGVPIRLEIGPKDVSRNQVTLVRRDTGEKLLVEMSNLKPTIKNILEDIQNNLLKRAEDYLKTHTWSANSIEKVKQYLDDKGGFVLVDWCGDRKCEDDIKEQTGADIRVIPFTKNKAEGNCVNCSKQGQKRVYLARAY